MKHERNQGGFTPPTQYDGQQAAWRVEGGNGSEAEARAGHFWSYLAPYSWEGKNVIDIGSGTGWTYPYLREAGVAWVVGIEPAPDNVAASHALHPDFPVAQTRLEQLPDDIESDFDIALAVMSFGHMPDLDVAFKKMAKLVKDNGEIVLVVPDYEYFTRPRYDYSVVVTHTDEVNRDEDIATVVVEKPHGTIVDHVRTPALFRKAAQKVGYELLEDIPMPPTEGYMQAVARYRESEGVPMTRLLRFGQREV